MSSSSSRKRLQDHWINQLAEILKDFKEEVMSFIREAAYLSGSDKLSNQKLEQALTIARQAMDQAREDLQSSEC